MIRNAKFLFTFSHTDKIQWEWYVSIEWKWCAISFSLFLSVITSKTDSFHFYLYLDNVFFFFLIFTLCQFCRLLIKKGNIQLQTHLSNKSKKKIEIKTFSNVVFPLMSTLIKTVRHLSLVKHLKCNVESFKLYAAWCHSTW